MDGWINDIAETTGMVLFGVAVALLLSVATSMLILREGWPTIKRQVVEEDIASYGVLTGAIFAAVCALVGVANRQSISPIWDPTFVERVTFMLTWVIYGQIVSFFLLYVVNYLLFG